MNSDPVFEVTTSEQEVHLHGGKPGTLSFVVTNTSDAPVDTEVRIEIEGDLDRDWCRLEPPEPRQLAAKEGAAYTLTIDPPAGAPASASMVTLTAAAVDRRSTVFTKGPMVRAAVHPGTPGIPLWPFLVGAGVVAALLLTGLWLPGWMIPTTYRAAFTADVTEGTAPLAVQFTDDSTPEPLAWSWDFDDGSTGEEADPHHVFEEPGSHRVVLATSWSEDDPELRDDATTDVVVYRKLEPQFDLRTRGVFASFENLSKGDLQEWTWDFGDGSPPSHEEHPTHEYPTLDEEKTYTVRLTVSADGDQHAEIEGDVVISKTDTGFTVDRPRGNAPLKVTFRSRLEGDQGQRWDFGDGSATSHDTSPTHVYREPGRYTVRLSVGSRSEASTIEVYQSPKISLSVATGGRTGTNRLSIPRQATADLSRVLRANRYLSNLADARKVAITAGYSVPAGRNVKFSWNVSGDYSSARIFFGDTADRSLDEAKGSITHTYSKAGTYTPFLLVIDMDNSEHKEAVTVEVTRKTMTPHEIHRRDFRRRDFRRIK